MSSRIFRTRIYPRVLAFGLAVFACAAPASAAKFATVDVKGVLVGKVGAELFIRLEDGSQVTASVNPDRVDDNVRYSGIPEPKVRLRALGRPQNLTPQAAVRAKVVLKGGGKAEPVGVIETFTPDENTSWGLTDLEGKPGDKPPDPRKATGPHLVVGRVANVTGRQITILYPGGRLLAPITADTTVLLDTSDHRLAAAGDKVKAKGQLVRAGKIFATEVEIYRGDPAKIAEVAAKISGGGKAPPAQGKDPAAAPTPPFAAKPDASKPANKPPRGKKGRILKVN